MANLEGLNAASDFAKQIITLSTGVITLTITFGDKLIERAKDAALVVPDVLAWSWAFYGISLVAGLWTLMATTGSTNDAVKSASETPPDAMTLNIRVPALVMVFTFGVATVLTICAGYQILS